MGRIGWMAMGLALIAWALSGACGDDDGGEEPPATPTLGSTGTATPAPPAVRGPSQFLYTVNEGDTLSSIGLAFEVGAEDLAVANGLGGEPIPGTRIRVPLRIPGDLAMLPRSGIEAALGIGGPGVSLLLLEPSLELRQGYLGRLALYAVQLAGGTPASEGRGYLVEYRQTDRAAFRAGAIDPEARFAGPAFTVAAGSLASTIAAGSGETGYRFEREGVPYAVVAAADAPLSAEAIAGMLEPAAGD